MLWYNHLDENAMMASVIDCLVGDGLPDLIPFHWVICGNCQGRGSTVNPAIDGNGLTAEDFAEDPDFREDYFSGVYDVPCAVCKGRRVVPIPDSHIDEIDRFEQEEYAYERECAAERRFGA